MLYLVACTILSQSSAFAAKFDPPDLNFEYQLHRQYVLSKGAAPLAVQGQLENYGLQKGETLWGLSQMLYGDGNYWPKVWAQNQAITNPHLIRPGHTLQFLLGSEDDTPAFRFSETDDGGLELAAANSSGAPVQIPPPEVPSRPVIKIPSSFPDYTDIYRKRRGDVEIDDSKMVIERKLPPDKFPLSAYVQETELNSVGKFLENEKESGLPVENQYVYVKMRTGVGTPGQKLLIVKDHGRIRKLNEQVESDIECHYIQVYGQVDLIDRVDPKYQVHLDKEKWQVYRALLVKAMNLSLTDYDLIPGQVETISMSKEGPAGSAEAQLIGSMKHQASALYGPGDIVFLNKGSQQGVSPGQIYDLVIDRTIRDVRTPVTASGYSSGLLKVVKASPNYATAVILTSVDSIQQGDRILPHGRASRHVLPPEDHSIESIGDELPPSESELE